MTDEQALALGRAVGKVLKREGSWPRVLVVHLLDHRRKIRVSELGPYLTVPYPTKDDFAAMEDATEVVVPGGGAIYFE